MWSKNAKFWDKNPIVGKIRGKIEIWSVQNLVCWKSAAVCPNIATSYTFNLRRRCLQHENYIGTEMVHCDLLCSHPWSIRSISRLNMTWPNFQQTTFTVIRSRHVDVSAEHATFSGVFLTSSCDLDLIRSENWQTSYSCTGKTFPPILVCWCHFVFHLWAGTKSWVDGQRPPP